MRQRASGIRKHPDPRRPLDRPTGIDIPTQEAGLLIERPGRYLDKGVRYYVRIDGVQVRPGLLPESKARLSLPAGEHTLEVSAERRRPSSTRFDLQPGQQLCALLLPASLRRRLMGNFAPTTRITPASHRRVRPA